MAIDFMVHAVTAATQTNAWSIANGTINLDASTDAWEVIAQSRSTDPITHIGIYVKALVGTTPTYKASVQGVNVAGTADAFPDGTIKGGGAPASVTFNPSSLGWSADSWKWLALDNSYTPAVGELVSFVVQYDSGTVDGSNYLRLAEVMGNAFGSYLPRVINNNAGSRTHRNGTFSGGWRTANRRYGGGAGYPIIAFSNTALTTETGLKFTVPSSIQSTSLVGMYLNWSSTRPTSSISVKGYAGGGAGDTTADFTDTIERYVAPVNGTLHFYLASPWTLAGGSTYRLALSASGGNTPYVDVTEEADFQMMPSETWSDLGMCLSTRSGGNWTDTATRRPVWSLMFADTTYAGGGGMIVHPGFTGGFRS